MSTLNVMSNSQHFAQVQASGYSPAMQRKKNSSILPSSIRAMGWMTEPAAPSAAGVLKDRDFTASHEATAQHDRQPSGGPQSILVRPDSHKNNTEKVMSYCWSLCILSWTLSLYLITVIHVYILTVNLYVPSLQSQCASSQMKTPLLQGLEPTPGPQAIRSPPTPGRAPLR